ncbi:MAG: poly-beta-1,6 N-acetyl-D-glucosamine export porin PgaA [Thermodesulfobacteriota bacterium]
MKAVFVKEKIKTLGFCLSVTLGVTGQAIATESLLPEVSPGIVGETSSSADGATRHAKALAAARENRLPEALALLACLMQEFPEIPLYRFDYIVTAVWAGRYQEGLEAAVSLPGEGLPPYVRSALARAARAVGKYDEALTHYRLLADANRADPDPVIGQIQTLLDRGNFSDALPLAKELVLRYPKRQDVCEALGRAYQQSGFWSEALEASMQLLEQDPGHPAGARLRFMALWRLGAPHAAEAVAPPDLTLAEEASLRHDMLVYEMRWAGVADGEMGLHERFDRVDRVIHSLENLGQRLESEDSHRELLRRVRADLVCAFADRNRMSECVAQYEKLAEEDVTPPAYAQLAFANALLRQEKPEMASRVFAPLLGDGGGDQVEFGLAYFYGLLESEEYRQALAYIDGLLKNEPEWKKSHIPSLRQPNENYPRVEIAAAMARSYTERLGEGQARLEELHRRAPANLSVNTSLAATYQMRGWHRRAEELLRWILGVHPDDGWIHLGLFESRMSLADYKAAAENMEAALKALPEEKAVARAVRAWETQHLRELRFEGEYGHSNDGKATAMGTSDSRVDAWLYAEPIQHRWRPFVHSHYSTASFHDITAERAAAGAGVESRHPLWDGSTEVYSVENEGVNFAFSGSYHPDDHWRIDGGYSSNALDTPLRAYADGVASRPLSLALSHRWHESRKVRIGAEYRDFSDENRRRSWFASWHERLVSGPVYRLAVEGNYYTSDNSTAAIEVGYFNPSRDRSYDVTAINEWTQFQRYGHSLKHRFLVGAGNYWQEGFGEGGVGSIRYEIVYAPSDRVEFRLGAGRTHRPYDGEHTDLDTISALADWRF